MFDFALKAKEIDKGVYRISGMAVYRYLFVGEKAALLMDTGYGIANLKKLVESITDKPLYVVNSHYHPDHSNGNQQFDKIYINENDLPFAGKGLGIEYLVETISTALVENHKWVKAIKKPLCNAMLCARAQKTEYVPVKNDHVFDLGGKTIIMHHVPGHTEGSCVLVDVEAKTIYTGDSCNTGCWLWTNPECTATQFADSLDDFADYVKNNKIKTLRCSHNPMADKPGFAKFYANQMRKLGSGEKHPLISIHLPGLDTPLCITPCMGFHKGSFYGGMCFHLGGQMK